MLLILGVAGSGKSTQSQMIAKSDGWVWLSMGQILRNRISGQLMGVMNSGKLLDDDKVEALLFNELKANKNSNIVLDGFPRRQGQCVWLLQTAKTLGFKIDAVVHLNTHDNVALNRLLKRGRLDDIPEAINERFKEYETDIKPLIDYLKIQSVATIEVNGEQSPEQVHQQIVDKLNDVGILL